MLTSFPGWDVFGRELRKMRRRAKLTQAQLGSALTLSPAVISLHERGHLPIDLERLMAWCSACDCTCRFECPDSLETQS